MNKKTLFESILLDLVENKKMSLGLVSEDISDFLLQLEDSFDELNSEKQNVVKATLELLVNWIKEV